jgi:hypothetical protein
MHPDRAIQRNGHQPVLATPLPSQPNAALHTPAAVAQPGPDRREVGRSDRHPRHRARRHPASGACSTAPPSPLGVKNP